MRSGTIVALAAMALLVLLWAMGNAVAGPPGQGPEGEGDVPNLSVPECPPGMVSYWKFDEGAGTIAYDPVGKNHGTILFMEQRGRPAYSVAL